MRTRPLLAAVIAVLVPAAGAAGVRPAYGGTVRVGVPAPLGAPGPGALLLLRATAAPLLELDARGTLVPGVLAEVPVAEMDGRAFRLRMRGGIVDHAGRPIGAEQLARHLAALLGDGARAGAWTALPILGADAVLEGRAPALSGVEVLSPLELLVTLAFPLPEFPWLLAALPAALPGAGPFVAGSPRVPSDALVLRANEHHHLGRPLADAIELRALDAHTAARQLEQGALDLVLRTDAAGALPGATFPALAVTVAVANGARLGTAAEPVRRTLDALDRGDLARRFVRAPAQPLRTIVPPAILPGDPAPPSAPVARAAAPRGRVSLLADASDADQRSLAQRLQVKLFDQGVHATLELADRARLAQRLARGDYDLALLSVQVGALRPALAAGQIVFAVRGAAAARRAMSEMAARSGAEALSAAERLGRELDLFPLVALAPRASVAPALQGVAPAADGTLDPGALWILGARR